MTEYRYTLRRLTGALPTPNAHSAVILMLNPSTATDEHDDPTIRRLKGFAARDGWLGFTVVNLFAARATDPRDLLDVADPVGHMNDDTIRIEVATATLRVAAWGSHGGGVGKLVERRVFALASLLMLDEWSSWGVTRDRSPRHPLYLRGDAELAAWHFADWRTVHAERTA